MSDLPYYDDPQFVTDYDIVWGDHEDDLPMYENFARRGTLPSLELGAGSGRVALHLARNGCDVVALDASPAMLDRLQSRLDDTTRPRVRIAAGDMRTFDLAPQRFGLIYCAANTFQHLLTHDDQIAAMQRIEAHLAPGGVFVAHMRTPRNVDWTAERTPLQLRAVKPLEGGEQLMQMHALVTSPATQTTTATYIFDRVAADGLVRRRVVDVTLRYTGIEELRLLFGQAGLRVAQVYADTDLSPFADDSDTMVVVAERA